MALGYNVTVPTGLIVWNMDEFNHPAPGISIKKKCKGLYCTWLNDDGFGHHKSQASDTKSLYEKLRANGAFAIGILKPMDCEGNRNYNLHFSTKIYTRSIH